MSGDGMKDFIVTATTDQGIRKDINQDRLFARRIETAYGTMAFAVICDGMGGLEKGEIASSALVQAFARWLENFCAEMSGMEIKDHVIRRQWTAIVEQVNSRILEYSRENGCKMGTTVTAMLITGQRYYILNIGDTRAYEISPYGMNQLTVDHTLIQREVEKGNLTKEQAERAPMKNVLTRCVGIEADVYPDLFFGDTKEGMIYLLCSDGFRHRISEAEVTCRFRNRDAGSGMKRCLELLIALGKQRGETDNISVITVQCVGAGGKS